MARNTLVDQVLAAGPAELLLSAGFSRRGRRFSRHVGHVKQSLGPTVSKWSLPGAVMFTLEGACSLDYLEDLVQGSARQRGTARALELACGRWPGVEDADRIVSGELEPFWTIRTETNAPEVGGTLTEYLDQMVLPWFRRHEREDCVLRTHIAQWMDEGRLDAVGHAFAAVVRARAGMAAEAASHLAEARSLAAQCRDDDEVGKLVEAAAAAVVAAAG